MRLFNDLQWIHLDRPALSSGKLTARPPIPAVSGNSAGRKKGGEVKDFFLFVENQCWFSGLDLVPKPLFIQPIAPWSVSGYQARPARSGELS